jgi:DNA topoisomerase-1
VRVLDGRYGPYVTDGTTNASVPKGTQVEAVTMPMAVDLLAARAGLSVKKGRGRKTVKATTKKAAPKKKSA